MDAVACRDIGPTPQNSGRALPHLHQIEQVERATLVIEEQIDIRIGPSVTPDGRTEQIEVLDTELLQLSLVLPQCRDDFVAFHRHSAAWLRRIFDRNGLSSLRDKKNFLGHRSEPGTPVAIATA